MISVLVGRLLAGRAPKRVVRGKAGLGGQCMIIGEAVGGLVCVLYVVIQGKVGRGWCMGMWLALPTAQGAGNWGSGWRCDMAEIGRASCRERV